MKTSTVFAVLLFSILSFSCKKNENVEAPAAEPVVDIRDSLVEACWKRGRYVVSYGIENPVPDGTLYTDPFPEWIENVECNEGSLIAKNMETQNETTIWSFPEKQEWGLFSLQKLSQQVDPVTETKYVDIYAAGTGDVREEKYYLRIVFGENISVIDYAKSGINGQLVGGDDLGDFYNGVAMVLPAKGDLYTVDINGNKKAELSNPYTDRDKSFLIGNAAVLNNNDYYSIVNAQGKTLLAEEGYSNVGALNVNGLYVITDQNGKIGLIDRYAEELVPCGNIDSVEAGVERASSESWKLESSKVAEDELYILHNGDMWAVYSALETKLITEFQKMDGEAETQYNCFLGNGGYPLIDEDGKSVYLISYNNENYKIIPVK